MHQYIDTSRPSRDRFFKSQHRSVIVTLSLLLSRHWTRCNVQSLVKAIFVWPWNENARTKQKQRTNSNTALWLVYRTDTNVRGFWLVKRTLGWKNFMLENFLEINRYLALTSYCNTNGQCLLHFRVFFRWKTKRPCFDLFIHWLIKKILHTYTETGIFQGHRKIASDQVRNWINWMILRSYANS